MRVAVSALAFALSAALPIAKAHAADQAGETEASWTVPTLHALGVMTTMRLSEAVIWPDPFADTSAERAGENYRIAFTQSPKWDSSRAAFEWDGDRWYVNTIGHALFGSELYLRVRTCRNGVLAALAFTAVGSAVWEYAFEANAVRPSGLDLWYTPVAGLVLGEARYLAWTAAATIRDRSLRFAIQSIVDPLGEMERLARAPC